MRILGLDFETAGKKGTPGFRPTEIGLVLVDTPSYRVLRTYSAIVNPDVESIDPAILEMTHLTHEMIRAHGILRSMAAEHLYDFLDAADAYVVWNGEDFDGPLVEQELMQFIGKVPPTPLIDLKIDLQYRHATKLTYAAADLGYLNPSQHTALGDVLTMLEVARRRDFKFADAIFNAQYPYVEVLAQVGPAKKDQANEVGYRWDPDRRIWVRKLRENLVELEKAARTFIVDRVPIDPVKDQVQSKGSV